MTRIWIEIEQAGKDDDDGVRLMVPLSVLRQENSANVAMFDHCMVKLITWEQYSRIPGDDRGLLSNDTIESLKTQELNKIRKGFEVVCKWYMKFAVLPGLPITISAQNFAWKGLSFHSMFYGTLNHLDEKREKHKHSKKTK